MSITPIFIAIVPAAGVGARASRAGQDKPKQYQQIKGKPMILWSVEALLTEPRLTEVIVAVSPEDDWAEPMFAHLPQVRVCYTGGSTRAETVCQTLDALDTHQDTWVLVHDAARPGLRSQDLSALMQCAEVDGCEGAILGLPVADTLKKSVRLTLKVSQIKNTVSREGLWQAQTPQMFRLGRLREAYIQALADNNELTDEASAVEYLGDSPMLVQGSMLNFKVTWPQDFDVMERCLDHES